MASLNGALRRSVLPFFLSIILNINLEKWSYGQFFYFDFEKIFSEKIF